MSIAHSTGHLVLHSKGHICTSQPTFYTVMTMLHHMFFFSEHGAQQQYMNAQNHNPSNSYHPQIPSNSPSLVLELEHKEVRPTAGTAPSSSHRPSVCGVRLPPELGPVQNFNRQRDWECANDQLLPSQFLLLTPSFPSQYSP